jgi:hypothetical protein
VVRVRVGREQQDAALAALEGLSPEVASAGAGDDPWLTVHVEPSRAGEVNQRLAEAGIYASGLEAGTDLEPLFLELTGGGASAEGTMQGIVQ